jgi:FG-GAP repeat
VGPNHRARTAVLGGRRSVPGIGRATAARSGQYALAGLVVADFNGDAKPDVAVTSANGVAVLLHV